MIGGPTDVEGSVLDATSVPGYIYPALLAGSRVELGLPEDAPELPVSTPRNIITTEVPGAASALSVVEPTVFDASAFLPAVEFCTSPSTLVSVSDVATYVGGAIVGQGPTPNEPGDTDRIQNAPLLGSVDIAAGTRSGVVTLALDAESTHDYRVELHAWALPAGYNVAGESSDYTYFGADECLTEIVATIELPSGTDLTSVVIPFTLPAEFDARQWAAIALDLTAGQVSELSNVVETLNSPRCGDGECTFGESSESCSEDCPTPVELCFVGGDEDLDDLFNCDDPDCASEPTCALCGDGACGSREDGLLCSRDCGFTVGTTAMDPDVLIGDGECRTASGQCSLAAAFDEIAARDRPGAIAFDIAGPGPHVIALTDNVVVLNEVRVDGSTQPGGLPPLSSGVPRPMITIEGVRWRHELSSAPARR